MSDIISAKKYWPLFLATFKAVRLRFSLRDTYRQRVWKPKLSYEKKCRHYVYSQAQCRDDAATFISLSKHRLQNNSYLSSKAFPRRRSSCPGSRELPMHKARTQGLEAVHGISRQEPELGAWRLKKRRKQATWSYFQHGGFSHAILGPRF